MAIIIEKESRCPLCGDLLDSSREYIATPPLISNTKDSLFIFSDAGIHRSCLDKNELKLKFLKHLDLYNSHLPLSKLKCQVDGKLIEDPNQLLYFGLLTSDDTEELYDFNYFSLNLKNIKKWTERSRFLKISEKFLAENKWESLGDFNKLKYVMEQVSIHLIS